MDTHHGLSIKLKREACHGHCAFQVSHCRSRSVPWSDPARSSAATGIRAVLGTSPLALSEALQCSGQIRVVACNFQYFTFQVLASANDLQRTSRQAFKKKERWFSSSFDKVTASNRFELNLWILHHSQSQVVRVGSSVRATRIRLGGYNERTICPRCFEQSQFVFQSQFEQKRLCVVVKSTCVQVRFISTVISFHSKSQVLLSRYTLHFALPTTHECSPYPFGSLVQFPHILV